jgi:molecular chaperone GrpE
MKNDNEMNEGQINETEEMIDDVAFEETNEEGEVSAKDTIKKLRERIKTLEKEKGEYMLGWQRANADYANFKKETESGRKEDLRFASKRLIRYILPVLDSYDLAKGNKEAWEKVDQNWRIGIEYIFGQLVSVLSDEGAVQYGKEGERFDPSLHESIELVDTDDESKDGKVAQVLQSGYKMGDTILRVARVKVYEKK